MSTKSKSAKAVYLTPAQARFAIEAIEHHADFALNGHGKRYAKGITAELEEIAEPLPPPYPEPAVILDVTLAAPAYAGRGHLVRLTMFEDGTANIQQIASRVDMDTLAGLVEKMRLGKALYEQKHKAEWEAKVDAYHEAASKKPGRPKKL